MATVWGMLVTEHPTAPVVSVLAQPQRLAMTARAVEGAGEVVGGDEAVGVFVAQHAVAPVVNVLAQAQRVTVAAAIPVRIGQVQPGIRSLDIVGAQAVPPCVVQECAEFACCLDVVNKRKRLRNLAGG